MAPTRITEDYYKILGVGYGADLQAIRNAYKRIALKVHPDHNRNENATAAFQQVR